MAQSCSEAVVLRAWPIRESDLVLSFFTRDFGLLRGVAKSALKSRKRFGGALEPMTIARAWFAERPRQDLVRLDQLEILASPLSVPVDHARLAVFSFFAELLDASLPERDPQQTVFRLLVAVLQQMRIAAGETPLAAAPSVEPWMPLTYFELWITRLMGILPDLAHCTLCHRPLQPGEVFYHPLHDGLFCAQHRAPGSELIATDSWQLALRILRAPVSAFATEPFPRRRAHDLRRFALQSIERHLEKKLRSAEALARLGG